MPFSDLRDNLILVDEQVATVEHDTTLLEEIDAPTIYPSHPDYFIRVYYDASRFSCEHALEDLFDRMQVQYAPRRIGLVDLDPQSLEYSSLSPFANMEKLFFKRGFVADVEGRVFRVGHVASMRFASATWTPSLPMPWSWQLSSTAPVMACCRRQMRTRRGFNWSIA